MGCLFTLDVFWMYCVWGETPRNGIQRVHTGRSGTDGEAEIRCQRNKKIGNVNGGEGQSIGLEKDKGLEAVNPNLEVVVLLSPCLKGLSVFKREMVVLSSPGTCPPR